MFVRVCGTLGTGRDAKVNKINKFNKVSVWFHSLEFHSRERVNKVDNVNKVNKINKINKRNYFRERAAVRPPSSDEMQLAIAQQNMYRKMRYDYANKKKCYTLSPPMHRLRRARPS